ncbi:hypothetical protein Bca52824_071298 [Brassica carinata]|uniref:Uncharacterized protein n=1 Tax=Brassica carinata TaxID=52824 RepID=A0A8X7QB04_BRACI|nr:hypothetical protein Bca52824_071298 [Brassica carinata]
MNFKHNTWFQTAKLLKPSPPSSLGRQTVDQATFAIPLVSIFPDQRNREQSDSTSLIHPLGRTKAEIQKLTVPKITVLRSCSLPAKERSLADHDLKLLVILDIKGEYSEIFSFRLIKGSPRYLIGNLPVENP